MKTTDKQPSRKSQLVLHLRRLRQWHGEEELSQTDLAMAAGISTRQLHRYETATELPEVLANVLALAHALDATVEDLIAPPVLLRLRDGVDERRCERDLQRDERAARYPRHAA